MKRLNLSIILATVLMLAGCKKMNTDMQNDVSDNIPITSQTDAKQVAYAEANLRKIGAEIAKLTKDDDFVNFIRTQVRKKFDTEYEVLVDDLKKNSTWATKLNSPNLNEGLAAFKNIGGISGYNFYPQIFIPKFQHDEESNNSSLSQYDSIKVVFYGGSTGNEESLATASYPAYSIDSAGLLHYWGIVDENYANENEVWVFSLSESVDAQGRLSLPCNDDYPCGGGGGGTGGGGTGGGGTGGGGTNPDIDPVPTIPHPTVNDPTHALVNCQIEHMRVNVLYESWLAGKSEVSIRAVLHCHNNRVLGIFNQFEEHYDSDQKNGNSYLGRLIRKFTRKEIRNGNIILVNYPLQIGWPTLNVNSDPIFFDYAIFERDNWPTGLRNTAISGRRDYIGPTLNQANNYSFNYRAKSFITLGFETNSLYAKGAITNTLSSFPGGNTYLNSPYNSDINTVYYANGFVISFLAAGINSPMFFNTKPF